MTLSELSIRRPVFAWMLMAGLLLFGGIAFQKMGVSQMPDVDFPVVNIGLVLEGAAPEVMETTVVEPVEDAVMSVAGIKSVTSSSKTGRANVTVEFALGKDIDVAVQEIQTTLAQVQRKLPRNIDPPVVSKSNPEDQPILWIGVLSDRMTDTQMMAFVRDRIKDKFTTVPGVSEIQLGGYQEPNLRVWVSSKKLDRYQLTVSDILGTIASEHSELPAGRIETSKQEFNIRSLGEALSAEEFGKLSINRRGGTPNFIPIPLSDVVQVEQGLDDTRRKSRSQGKAAVGLGIKKQRGSNAVGVAQAAKARMKELQKTLPPGVELGVNFDSTQFIEEAVHELNFTLVLSAFLTALVCWAFLGSWSATMNVVLSIPVSIIGTFIVLYAMGFTLNLFTLLGLSLAIGIVVDDAIMVLENIVRHREMGKGKTKAAIDGSIEITFAAIAATAAIMAIFLPVAFMDGIIGAYFFQFGVTLSVAVLLSLLEALTLAPMRCAAFLHVGKRATFLGRAVDEAFDWSAKFYGHLLAKTLNWRGATIAIATIVFVGSLFMVKLLKKEFVPAQDQSRLLVRVQAPLGSSLAYTDAAFTAVEKKIMARPDVDRYYAAIGGFGGGEVDRGVLFVTLKPLADRPIDPKKGSAQTQQEIATSLRADFKEFKDLKIFIQDLSLSGFSARRGFPIEFTIRGPDWEKLIAVSRDMMGSMAASGLMVDVDSDYQEGAPEVQVVPNREKARQRGVSVTDINETINAMMGGAIAGKYSQGNRRFDIRVRLLAEERTTPNDILRLHVRNNRGELVQLGEVVDLKEKASLQAISHQDRERAISVFANVAPTSTQEKAIAAIDTMKAQKVPEGYRLVLSGSSQTFQESFQALFLALILGIMVSYMVLASQFNSFLDPITVLIALPFSLTGAFLSLLIANQSLNLYSAIGILLLMGIVKKNSILLVDFTNQVRDRGVLVREALLEACPQRLRPILMTSIATIVAAVPPALAVGPGAESRVPMALVIIGGCFLSTFLTLFVVPCVYSVFARTRQSVEEQIAHESSTSVEQHRAAT